MSCASVPILSWSSSPQRQCHRERSLVVNWEIWNGLVQSISCCNQILMGFAKAHIMWKLVVEENMLWPQNCKFAFTHFGIRIFILEHGVGCFYWRCQMSSLQLCFRPISHSYTGDIFPPWSLSAYIFVLVKFCHSIESFLTQSWWPGEGAAWRWTWDFITFIGIQPSTDSLSAVRSWQ